MFYDVFNQLCQYHHISCTKAATEIGLSNATPTKWKKTGATPDGVTLTKISKYFGVPVDFLIEQPNSILELTSMDNELWRGAILSAKTRYTASLNGSEQEEKPAPQLGDGLDFSDLELLEAFREAPEYKKDAIRDLLGLK